MRMGYRCARCKRIVDINEFRIQCECGHPILVKERPTIIKKVKAE